MILFIYAIFRLFILLLLNIGWQTDTLQAQATPAPRKQVPDSTEVFNQKLVEAVFDSTMRAVQELKDIPKSSEKVIKKNKKLVKRLDSIYYESIIPLKYLTRREAGQPYAVTPQIQIMPHIQEIQFINNEICVDSLPYKVDPAVPLSRTRKTFFQKIKSWFK